MIEPPLPSAELHGRRGGQEPGRGRRFDPLLGKKSGTEVSGGFQLPIRRLFSCVDAPVLPQNTTSGYASSLS